MPTTPNSESTKASRASSRQELRPPHRLPAAPEPETGYRIKTERKKQEPAEKTTPRSLFCRNRSTAAPPPGIPAGENPPPARSGSRQSNRRTGTEDSSTTQRHTRADAYQTRRKFHAQKLAVKLFPKIPDSLTSCKIKQAHSEYQIFTLAENHPPRTQQNSLFILHVSFC